VLLNKKVGDTVEAASPEAFGASDTAPQEFRIDRIEKVSDIIVKLL
jgi:hypothetical protein